MRLKLAPLSLPLLALAACGGDTRPQTVGNSAPGGSGGGGSGGGVGSPTPAPTPTPAHFLDITAEASFDAIGSMHSLHEGDDGTLYRGNASTVRDPSGEITYNPRDGIFEITFADTLAGIDRNLRFQDPAHRTNFPNTGRPYYEVPDLPGFNYLEALDVSENATFFYQRPGNTADHVSLAGFVRTENDTANNAFDAEHGVFVFGSLTPTGQVPITGTASYTGGFIATMVTNPTLDNPIQAASVMQWITGSSGFDLNFGTGAMSLFFDGAVSPGYVLDGPIPDAAVSVPSGTNFFAQGTATIDLVRTGGFAGRFSLAEFRNPNGSVFLPVDFRSINPDTDVAGASSIDGTFFGPNGVNLGGDFRIIGGVPDQRVDIHGAFNGARQP